MSRAYDRCQEEVLDVTYFPQAASLPLDWPATQGYGGASYACQAYPNIEVSELFWIDTVSFANLSSIVDDPGYPGTIIISGLLQQDAASEVEEAANVWESMSPSELFYGFETTPPQGGWLQSKVQVRSGYSAVSPSLVAHTATYYLPADWQSANVQGLKTVITVWAGDVPALPFTWGNNPDEYADNIRLDQILIHEFGHAGGIHDHHVDNTKIMGPTQGIGVSKVLSNAASNAMMYLYHPIPSQRPTPL